MKFDARVIEGNRITIPKKVANELGLKKGAIIKVEIVKVIYVPEE